MHAPDTDLAERGLAAAPTVVSLCCGVGGMDLGFVAAGFRVIYAADFNPAAVETYRRNLGEHAVRADLTTLDPASIPDADVWIAGPPCQSFSLAGKRLGADDDRDMWPHVLRLLEVKRPAFAVFENVRGLLSWSGGEYVHAIDARLRGMGYAITRAVLDAADYGVPQRRHRVFFLCRLGGPAPAPPWPTHQDPARMAQRSLFDVASRRPWVTVRQALGLGGAPRTGRLDRPAPVVTTMEGRQLSPTDYTRVRKAGALLGDISVEDRARIIAQRNAARPGHGGGATVDTPSVTVGAGNPPRWAGPAVAVASKRKRSTSRLDTPSVTLAADGREALVALPLPGVPVTTDVEQGEKEQPCEEEAPPLALDGRDAPAPTLASSGGHGGGAHIDGGAVARRAWQRLGIDPRSLLDEPSATIRAGTHGQGGWSPRHRAGYVADPDSPSPTLFMGGHRTERTPGGGGVHQWSVADDAPRTGEAPSQTIDSSGEWHRPGRHRGSEPSRGPNSATYLRRLTVREAARLQAFPDWFAFQGAKTARYAQIGNAVPSLLAWHMANAIRVAMGLPAVAVPDVLEWYVAARPQWAAGEGVAVDAEADRRADTTAP